jgi:hypothetical protein
MEDRECYAIDDSEHTIRELLNRGFNIVYHERQKPGTPIAVSYEATNKAAGLRFSGWSRAGVRSEALAQLANEAAQLLNRPKPALGAPTPQPEAE